MLHRGAVALGAKALNSLLAEAQFSSVWFPVGDVETARRIQGQFARSLCATLSWTVNREELSGVAGRKGSAESLS